LVLKTNAYVSCLSPLHESRGIRGGVAHYLEEDGICVLLRKLLILWVDHLARSTLLLCMPYNDDVLGVGGWVRVVILTKPAGI